MEPMTTIKPEPGAERRSSAASGSARRQSHGANAQPTYRRGSTSHRRMSGANAKEGGGSISGAWHRRSVERRRR